MRLHSQNTIILGTFEVHQPRRGWLHHYRWILRRYGSARSQRRVLIFYDMLLFLYLSIILYKNVAIFWEYIIQNLIHSSLKKKIIIHNINYRFFHSSTSRLRNIFFKFDDNKDGRATKEQILQGFKDMGVEVDDEIKAKVTKLDTNNDGKVAYQDFVQSQLLAKGVLK